MGGVSGTLANVSPETISDAIHPVAVANAVRGSVLLVAGFVTDSEDAISLGRQIASGCPEQSPSSASAARQPSPEEVAEMHLELQRWKLALHRAKSAPSELDASEMAGDIEQRERELREIEERHRQLEEEVKNYPRPEYLGESEEDIVNIAVVGNSGVGKSLLINSFRGVGPGEESWAPVGVNQTTSEPVAYPMPGHMNIRLWDLAGAGALYFRRGEYTRTIGLRHFDIVVVVTTCRFTQTEAVLLSELAGNNVPSFLVRTMVDVDICSNQADHGQCEAETKRGIVEDLRERGVKSCYLINARAPDEHDFPRLQEDVLRVAHEGPDAHPEVRAAMQAQDDGEASKLMPKYEVGEVAELWSKQHNIWVKCVIEKKCEKPDEYSVTVPTAQDGRQLIPKVPSFVLRKVQVFNAGDDAEIIIVKGPRAGSWIHCQIVGKSDKPDMFDVCIPEAPPPKRNQCVHVAALRMVQKPLVEIEQLREIMKAFKEICSTKEFQATIAELQEIGTQRPEVRTMKKTFVINQFNPVLLRHNLSTSKLGWALFLGFTRTRWKDDEVRKLANEVERLMQVRVGDFFGIAPGKDEQKVVEQRDVGKLLKDSVTGMVNRTVQRYHDAAKAQYAAGAPTARAQQRTGGADPMSRSMTRLR